MSGSVGDRDKRRMNSNMAMRIRYRLALGTARRPRRLLVPIARAITVSTANTLFGRAGSQLATKMRGGGQQLAY
ncbi:hypothetical protein VAWG002_22260 [Aeromonas veronii]|nr:hypothetical protein VAWG002_22260 [Aeromonas veronii]